MTPTKMDEAVATAQAYLDDSSEGPLSLDEQLDICEALVAAHARLRELDADAEWNEGDER